MKRKMKITISALAVMFVAAIAVAIASFSFAGNGNEDDLVEDAQLLADASQNLSNKTIIDYIIDNSNSTDDEVDKVYHIAEITSGSDSTLTNYVSTNAFKDYVIDGNRTIEQAMAENCVEIKSFKASVDDDASLAYISKADFIYVTNDAAAQFSKTNDMSEKLYDVLHTYSIGDFKPLVIDNPSATSVNTSTSRNMKELASSVFLPNEKYYYAFKWKSGLAASDYLAHNGSLYLGINGQTQSSKWKSVYEGDPTADPTLQPVSMAKILTVSQSGSSTTKTDALLEGNTLNPSLYMEDGSQLVADAGVRFYHRDSGSSMDLNGYNARKNTKPMYFENDIVTLSQAESSAVNFDEYDMIVIEDDCFGQDISAELYRKFGQAMYGKVHIVYGAEMGTADASTPDVPDDLKETVYKKLFYMVATTDYTARYENIMVTTRADFSVITTSESAATAKVIAELINASKYRGIGGRGSSGSMFTVLELQPCYPIDEEVAQEVGKKIPRSSEQFDYPSLYGNGNYYTLPSGVVDGKTKDQLEENTEYYAWDLSKAELADALNLSVDQINLVHMSTEEFACDKAEVAGQYDLIYIGGNTSALKRAEEYRSLTGLAGWDSTIGNHPGNVDLTKLSSLPIYTMYSHNGDMVTVDLASMAQSPGPANSGTPTAQVMVNGKAESTFALLNGNDITYNRYQALKEYIDSGMPVIVDEDLSQAFTVTEGLENHYLQNTIDPDSNMYKVLQACKASTEGNVLWNFNQKDVEKIQSDGTLGESVSGYVHIFSQDKHAKDTDGNITATVEAANQGPRALLSQLYASSAKRPKLTLTSMPATYNRFDDSSKLTEGLLKYKYNITGGSGDYSVKLYIDDDGNSKFDRSEEFMTSGDKTALTYQCSSKFFGPLYWLIEVRDNKTGLTVNQTGIAYVKNKSKDPQRVNVLQIMPGEPAAGQTNALGEGPNKGYNSLYFCTVCQQAYRRLEYNPYTNSGNRTAFNAQYGGNYFDSANGYVGSHYLGKHEHKFGIVSYDSNLLIKDGIYAGQYGYDDWDSNLADQVSDLYDFDIDIMHRSEFEQTARDVEAAYAYVVDSTTGEVNYKKKVSDSDKEEKVKNFSIDASDTEYEKYQALKTTDEKYDFIMKREYQQLAGKYWQLYQYMANESAEGASQSVKDENGNDISKTTVDERKALDEEIDKMIDALKSPKGYLQQGPDKFSDSSESVIAELERLKKMGTYSDYYSINNNKAVYNDVSLSYLPNGESMNTYYANYVKAKDKELTYKELYKKYSRYAAGSEWLQDCYSTVVIGPSEDFGGDDITDATALADLKQYIADDKQLLLFHDTLTKFKNSGTAVLTATLRESFGMDRYHMNPPETDDADSLYVKYTTTEDTDKYFMTNLSTTKDESKYKSWYNDMKAVFSYTPKKYLTSVAYTDALNLCADNINPYSMPYRYAEFRWAIAASYYTDAAMSAKKHLDYGTDRASQNNQGIVTLFPFTLASELNISGTHPQAYALDLEDDDMTVWYSLAGGNNKKLGSSMFAATPRDGMDNYFIYTYKNVNYCGAGHSKVTGVGKDNNDERYLYINIICNSVRNSVQQPTIAVYDYGTENNYIIKRDSSDAYYTKVDSDTSYPDFSFKVTVDKSEDVTLSNVKIFYDLDYSEKNTSDAYVADENHVLIADWNASTNNVQAGVVRDVFRYDQDLIPLRYRKNADGSPMMSGDSYVWETEKYTDEKGVETEQVIRRLKLQPEYFKNYNNEYTYLVIEATDSAGNKVYQRIKIMIKPHLFDLT